MRNKSRPIVPDKRNTGGRTQISQLMFNHYNALFHMKPVVKLPPDSYANRPQSAKPARSKLNPQGDFSYKDINPKIPLYVYDPLTRENSGILGERYQYGIFRGKTNYKEADKIAIEHMFNLRSQRRKIIEMERNQNMNGRSSMVESPYTNPVYLHRARMTRYPQSSLAHVTRIYPAPEPHMRPHQQRQPTRSEVRESIGLPKKSPVFKGNSLRAKASDREASEIVNFATHDPKIKAVQMVHAKKRKLAPKKQTGSAELELTDWVRKKRPWSKKTKREGKPRRQRQGADEEGVDSADDEEAGPIAIKEHDHIDPIQEKPEREEDEQTNTVNIGEGNSQSKKSYDLKKTSSHNLKARQSDGQVKKVESDGEAEERFTGQRLNGSSQHSRSEGGPKQQRQAAQEILERRDHPSQSLYQGLKTTELVREVAGDEQQDQFEEAELQDIPVLRSGSEEDTEDFVQKLGLFIQNYEIEDPEQLQLLYEEVAKRNPNVPEEDLAQIFEGIINQLQDMPDDMDDEDENIKMVA